MQKKQEKVALSAKQVEQVYSIPIGSLANMRWRREGPKFYKVNRRVVYFAADIEDWLTRFPVLTTDCINL